MLTIKHAITYSEDTILRITPSNLTLGEEGQPIPIQLITFSIEVENISNLYSWQIALYYNSSILHTQEEWIWLPQNHIFSEKEFNTTPLSIGVDENGEYITFASTLNSGEQPFNGSGTLFAINFTAIAPGTAHLNFSKHIGSIQGSMETYFRNPLQEDISAIAVEGTVEIKGIVKDIAVTKITLSKTVVGKSYSFNVSAKVENQGSQTETFNLTFYANSTIIETKSIIIESNASTEITSTCNTTKLAKGNYTITVYAWPLTNEMDTVDNNLTSGWVTVTIPGDVDGNFKVEGKDVASVAKLYDIYQESPQWESNVDVNGDSKIDGKDIAIIAKNFGVVWYETATIILDKLIYHPNITVFQNPLIPTPMQVKVIDGNVNLDFVTVRISSSVESREVNLTKKGSGVFQSRINIVGLRLNETINNITAFQARYGDAITIQYFDSFYTQNITANALFAFPTYVDDYFYKDPSQWKLFDAEGVPLAQYAQPIGTQYNPVTTSQYALALYYKYLETGDTTYKQKFLIQANWLVRTAKVKGNYSVWEYLFDWPIYNLTNPWVSAMAQGQAISVLTRAYTLTQNNTFLEVINTAMGAFEVEKDLGGVRFKDTDGIWFEEYADPGDKDSKVLNGLVFALYGLYEYSFETNSSKGYSLFWIGTNTLEANIHRYDTGYWSYYDLLGNIASKGYHLIHIEQLDTMYQLTGIELFQFYSNKFRDYL